MTRRTRYYTQSPADEVQQACGLQACGLLIGVPNILLYRGRNYGDDSSPSAGGDFSWSARCRMCVSSAHGASVLVCSPRSDRPVRLRQIWICSGFGQRSVLGRGERY